MALVFVTLVNPGIYNITSTATANWTFEVEGGGGGGGNGSTGGGGGGGGGGNGVVTTSVASGLLAQITVPDSVTGGNSGLAGSVFVNSSLVMSVSGGSIGGNGSVTAGGSGGAGGSATGTGVTSTTGTAGSAGAIGSAGAGGKGATAKGGAGGTGTAGAGTAPGGGGSGGLVTGAGGGGARGQAWLTIPTGNPTIAHTATMSRLATLSRTLSAVITETAVFSRAVISARTFAASIAHTTLRFGMLLIFLPRTASVSHVSAQTQKAVTLPRTATITHVSSDIKAIVLAVKSASIVHTTIFNRAVTVRRSFAASISHVRKMFMYLEGRLIPTGVGTVLSDAQLVLIRKIHQLHGLADVLNVSATARTAGDLTQSVSVGTGTTSIATTGGNATVPGNPGGMIEELAALHGLTATLTVTDTSRTAGTISQTIETAGGTTTVTRTA